MRLLMEEIGFRLYLMENSSLRDFQFCTDLPDRTPISHHQRVKVVGIFNEFFRRTDIQLVLKIEFLIDIIFHRI